MAEHQPSSWLSRLRANAKAMKWIKWGAAAVAAVILLLLLLTPTIVRAVIRHELQANISEYLNATLEIDDLSWHPLLGVSIGHARLMGTLPDGTPAPVAELTGLNTSLAGIPFGGPIVVSDFVLLDPSIDLIRLPSGEIDLQQNLLKSQPSAPSSGGKAAKPSSMIQVKHFQISDLTVALVDWSNPAHPAQTWVRLDVDGKHNDSGPGDYDVHVALAEKPLTQLSLDLSANIDGASITMKNFSFTAQAPGDNDLSQLPPEIASFIKDKGLTGAGVNATIADGAALTADLDQNHWTLRGFNGHVDFTTASGTPLAGGSIVFSATAGGPLPGPGAPVGLEYLTALDKDTALSIHTDPNSQLMLHVSGLPQPITQGGFDFEYVNGTATLKTFDAHYGQQTLHLDLAADVGSDNITLSAFHLNVAGGTVTVKSAELFLTQPNHYAASVQCQNIQLSDLMQLAQLNSGGHIAGVAAGDVTVTGPLALGTSPLATAQGNGRFSVEKADVWDFPALGQVAGKAGANLGAAGRIGEAAGVFTIGDGALHFSKLAVNCPIVGIQGSGDVGLVDDNPLKLNLVVVPLGNVKKEIDNTGIPGISILGQAVGSIQKTVTKVSKSTFLSFDVTGPAANPSIQPAAAPAVTGAAKDLFDNMSKAGGSTGGGLLNLLQGK
jgi:hypothetical protein